MRVIYIILLLFVALSGKAEDINASIEIIRPFEQTKYIGESTTFVIDVVDNKVDKIVLTQDDNITTNIEVTSARKTYCKTINIKPGLNTIVVSSYKDSTLVQTLERKIFFLSELFEGINDDSEGFKQRYFHNNQEEEKCKSCHSMKSNVPKNGQAFEDVSQTTCYNCHKKMINTKNTHAPTANWLCLDCHNGKFGEFNMEDEGASKYLAPDPISKACGTCHEDVDAWKASKYGHGPVNDGRCERCHNPHGSDNEFFLRKHIWNLCTTCHTEKANGKHIVSSFVYSRNSGSHPTKGIKDPSRPEREFTCSSCHNPHGSTGIFLLRMKGSVPFGVCNRCHKK